jgi:hypothetical protein
MSEEKKAETEDNPLLGSDEDYTLDADEFKERKNKRRQKLLEAEEIENPNSEDGNKEEYSIEDVSEDKEDYSLKEGRSTPRAKKTESETQKSPLQ